MHKMNVIQFIRDHEELTHHDVADHFDLHRSQPGKWLKAEDSIAELASTERGKLLRKVRTSRKHNEVYKELWKVFSTAREKGLRVLYKWLWCKGRAFTRNVHGPNALFPISATHTFVRRYNVKVRRKQRNKVQSKASFGPKMQRWHANLRERSFRARVPSL